MVKVVLIDIDNTILDFNKSARQSMMEAGFELSVTLPEDIYDIYKRVNSLLWQRLERGEISMAEIFAVRWNTIFGEAGIDYDGVAFESCYRDRLKEAAVPVEGAEELLEYLSDKYLVCAASNGVWTQQVNRLKNAGFYNYIRAVYTSDVMGFQKPTREFYTECLKKASLLLPIEKQPIWNGETVMIGDSLTADINGVKKFGIEPIWFNFEGIDASPEDPSIQVVTRLEELTYIL